MARKVLSEAATVRAAIESTLSAAPSAGHVQLQPNPGGIEIDPELETIERDPLSVYASMEKGDVVGLKANVKITHDVNMDLLGLLGPLMFRSSGVHPGGTASAFFRPTVVVDGGVGDDSFTVPANGALAAGTLIFTQGFANPANNGLFVVTAASTGTSIKVGTGLLVAEAAAPGNATLWVVGRRAASADVTINASNHLTSTALNFTTLNIPKGAAIIIGGETTITRFATLIAAKGDRPCVAYVKTTPTANLIELTDHNWTVAGLDAGAGKTIDLYFGLFFANRPLNDALYREDTLHIELEDQEAATGGTVPTYTYGKGCALGMIEINAPLKNKMVATLSFVGTDIPDPVLTAARPAGGGGGAGLSFESAYAPLSTAMFDTSNDLEEVQLYDAAGALVAEVNSWKLSINNNVKPREIQGTLGAIDHIFGKFQPSISFEGYFTDYDQIKAARANRDLKWRVFVGNHQGGFALRMPYTALRQPKKSYSANEAVMLGGAAPGFRDPDTNTVMSMTLFGYVPFGGD